VTLGLVVDVLELDVDDVDARRWLIASRRPVRG
jgi:hypothetical protein